MDTHTTYYGEHYELQHSLLHMKRTRPDDITSGRSVMPKNELDAVEKIEAGVESLLKKKKPSIESIRESAGGEYEKEDTDDDELTALLNDPDDKNV